MQLNIEHGLEEVFIGPDCPPHILSENLELLEVQTHSGSNVFMICKNSLTVEGEHNREYFAFDCLGEAYSYIEQMGVDIFS